MQLTQMVQDRLKGLRLGRIERNLLVTALLHAQKAAHRLDGLLSLSLEPLFHGRPSRALVGSIRRAVQKLERYGLIETEEEEETWWAGPPKFLTSTMVRLTDLGVFVVRDLVLEEIRDAKPIRWDRVFRREQRSGTQRREEQRQKRRDRARRRKLQHHLDLAIAEERYEEAKRLNDKLSELEGRGQ